jgi:hypothetical protein
MSVNAVSKINDTIQAIKAASEADMDANPVIAPVIDLTQFRKDAAQMGSILPAPSVDATVSYRRARALSAANVSQANQAANAPVTPGGNTLQFIQNNTSPESLSTLEIYRQTTNQLSQVERALEAVSA